MKHGLTENPDWVRICDNRAQAEAITPEILEQDEVPDAFFAINDDTAIGILYTAKRMGYAVPDDISICGLPMATVPRRATLCLPPWNSEA